MSAPHIMTICDLDNHGSDTPETCCRIWVLSALTVSHHETSRRAERGTGIKAAAITVWRQLKEAYQRYERRER